MEEKTAERRASVAIRALAFGLAFGGGRVFGKKGSHVDFKVEVVVLCLGSLMFRL